MAGVAIVPYTPKPIVQRLDRIAFAPSLLICAVSFCGLFTAWVGCVLHSRWLHPNYRLCA